MCIRIEQTSEEAYIIVYIFIFVYKIQSIVPLTVELYGMIWHCRWEKFTTANISRTVDIQKYMQTYMSPKWETEKGIQES